jgi:hypothetical protein
LDPKGEIISYRYFRDSCYKTEEGFYAKDLRVIDRDLAKMLLIDNVTFILFRLLIVIAFNLKMECPLFHFMIIRPILNLKI